MKQILIIREWEFERLPPIFSIINIVDILKDYF